MKLKTIAFDFDQECFNPLVQYASTDQQNASLSMNEYRSFMLEYGNSKDQSIDPSNPMITEAFEKIADEYCNKLFQNCDNQTIPISDEINNLSPYEKVFMFYICEESFLTVKSLFAIDTPSSSPSHSPSIGNGGSITNSIKFSSYSSLNQSEISKYFYDEISSWAKESASRATTEDVYYQYRYLNTFISITSCSDKKVLKKVNQQKTYCYDIDLNIYFRSNSDVRSAQDKWRAMLNFALESGLFNECGYSFEFKDETCTVYSFLSQNGYNQTTVALSAVGVIFGLILFYWIRRSSLKSNELHKSSFPIKIPLMPEFDEEILIEGGKGIHIIGTWSEDEELKD